MSERDGHIAGGGGLKVGEHSRCPVCGLSEELEPCNGGCACWMASQFGECPACDDDGGPCVICGGARIPAVPLWRLNLRAAKWAGAWTVASVALSIGIVLLRTDPLLQMIAGLLFIYGGMSGGIRAVDGMWEACKAMWRKVKAQ